MKYLFITLFIHHENFILYRAISQPLLISNLFPNKIGLLLCHSHIELRLWLRLSWGWGWLEPEVDWNLRLKWGWDEVEWKFSWNWVEVELSWGWDKLTLNKGRNWAFIGVGLWFKICSRTTFVFYITFNFI